MNKLIRLLEQSMVRSRECRDGVSVFIFLVKVEVRLALETSNSLLSFTNEGEVEA